MDAINRYSAKGSNVDWDLREGDLIERKLISSSFGLKM